MSNEQLILILNEIQINFDIQEGVNRLKISKFGLSMVLPFWRDGGFRNEY